MIKSVWWFSTVVTIGKDKWHRKSFMQISCLGETRMRFCLMLSSMSAASAVTNWFVSISPKTAKHAESLFSHDHETNSLKQESPPIGGAVRNATSFIPQRLVYNTCYRLFRKRSCMTVHWLSRGVPNRRLLRLSISCAVVERPDHHCGDDLVSNCFIVIRWNSGWTLCKCSVVVLTIFTLYWIFPIIPKFKSSYKF